MVDLTDVRATIIPKSDQLNADDLVGGPMTITVSEVRLGGGDEQPIVVKYEGDNGRPYKPCKTMRKVLIFAWGENAHNWAGKSMTLYNDPSVKFGGEAVGGIRISHMTDIDQEVRLSLNTTRGKKGLYVIHKMAPVKKRAGLDDRLRGIVTGFERAARERGFQAFKDAWDLLPKEDKAAIGKAERDRIGDIGRQHDSEAGSEEEAA